MMGLCTAKAVKDLINRQKKAIKANVVDNSDIDEDEVADAE